MAWIIVDPKEVQGKFAAAELQAIQTVQLSEGQEDPVPTELANVLDEVRGYCAVRNTLGPAGTIPSKLKDAALAITAYRIASRLPVASLLTNARERAYTEGIALLTRVAQGLFRIEVTVVEDTENSGTPKPSFKGRTPRYQSRASQDGI